jgi:hypothetical protein
MRIVQVHAMPLFTGTATQPHQIVRVTVAGAAPGADTPTSGPVLVRVEGPGISTRQPFRIENLPPGTEQVAEVPVTVAAPHGPGSTLAVTAIAEAGGGRATLDAGITPTPLRRRPASATARCTSCRPRRCGTASRRG